MKPELTITKDLITIDTKSALNGEDILHLTNAHAIDDRTGQDLTSKLLVNMADVKIGQVGIYDANISILDENGNLQPLRQIAIKIVAAGNGNEQDYFSQPTRRQTQSTQQQATPKYAQQQPAQNLQQEQMDAKKPRKKKKHWGKKIFYVILGLLAIYLVWTGISYHQTRQQVDDQGRQIGELQRKNDSLGDQLDTANTQIKELRQNYKTTKDAVKNYKKDEEGYRQQYLSQMQQVSQSLASLKQQLDNQTQQSGLIYSILNGRLDNLQTTVNQMLSVQSADQAQNVLNNYKWYK
ncbi:hypothetical protein [Ligilactobacillus acidipiscis]|uniref:Uncharacterized protein n=1 Tax=Ligilactobacillus acidipiscis TaxID=89059 RepID=A0A0R2JM43_9LACO|nr:hypothetical protein [Ligilactobacillus acidipiscis]KRN75900.1 hypothetical protein IV43_GL000796 [Ligilactobacillus acidipiscis]